MRIVLLLTSPLMLLPVPLAAEELSPLAYHNPGLVVDLHVGLWAMPIPTDVDDDGDTDLLVNCPDVPMRGLFLFENLGPKDGVLSDRDAAGRPQRPLFAPPVRVAPSYPDLTPSYTDAGLRLLSRNVEVAPDGS